MREVGSYKENEDIFGNDFMWVCLEDNKMNPVVWWKSYCATTNLSKIAVQILNSPPTTAATERSFSTFGNVHTIKGNRLKKRRAAQLVYVQHSLKLQENILQMSDQYHHVNAVASETSDSEDQDDCDDELIEIIVEESEA